MGDYSLGTARGRIEIDASGASAGADEATEALEGVNETSEETESAFESVSNVAGAAGAGIAAGFGLSLNAAADFEQRMSAVSAVSGATGAEFDSLRDKALQLGKDTSFGATEAASAIEELVKAGLTVDDVMNGAADATVALAAAGEIALPEAATIASNAMNQFGIDAAELPRIADLIAGASNASAIGVSDLGNSLSQVGAVANLAGLSFEDTAVAIAEMGNAGIIGSDAGTSLKTMLSNLQPTTEAQAAVFEELGITAYDSARAMDALRANGIEPIGPSLEQTRQAVSDYLEATQGIPDDTEEMGAAVDEFLAKSGAMGNAFYDAQGNVKGLADIQQILQDSTAGLTTQQKQLALETMFGSDAIRAAAVMADAGAAGFQEMSDAMNSTTAADVAATRMNNFKGSLEQLKGTIETVSITVGTIILPIMQQATEAVGRFVEGFLNLAPGTQSAIVAIAGTVAGLLLFIAATIRTVAMVQGFIATVKTLAVALKLGPILAAATAGFWNFIAGLRSAQLAAMATTGVMGTLGGAVRKAAVAFKVFTIALLTNPIFLIIAAIVALGVALWAFFTKTETGRAMWASIWSGIQSAIDAVVGWITGSAVPWLVSAWDSIVSAAQSMWDGLVSIWNGITSFISAAVSLIVAVVTGVGSGIRTAWETIWNGLTSVVSTVWNAITGFVSTGIALVMSVISSVGGGLLAVWQGLWNVFGPVVVAVWELIKAAVGLGVALIQFVIGSFLLGLQIIWNTIWNSLTAVVSVVWAAILAVIVPAVQWIQDAITVGLAVISSVWNAIWGTLTAIVEAVWNVIVAVVTAYINTVLSVVTAVWNVISSVTSSVWNAISGVISAVWAVISSVVSGAVNAVKSVVTSVFNAIKAVVTTTSNNIQTGITAAWNAVKSITSSVWNALTGVIGGALSNAYNKVTDMIARIKGVFSGAGSWLKDAGKKIIQGLIDGITSKIGAVTSKLKDLTSMIPKVKGPPKKDAKLLYGAGELIIGGLERGIGDSIPSLLSMLGKIGPGAILGTVEGNMSGTGTANATGAATQGGNTFNFYAYGNDASSASDVQARRMRALSAMGAF